MRALLRPVELDWSNNAIGFLRLALASLVLLGHAPGLGNFDGGGGIPPLLGEWALGSAAVIGFMFMSGVLITRSWENSRGFTDFMTRRVLRIFPAYWVCLIAVATVFAGLWLVSQGQPLSAMPWTGPNGAATYPLANFALFQEQAYIRGLFDGEGANFPLWTILSEFACYFLTAIAGVLGLGKKYRAAYLAAASLLILYFVYKVTASAGTFDIYHGQATGMLNRLVHLEAYLIGVCFYYYKEHIPLNWGLAVVAYLLTNVCSRVYQLEAFCPLFFSYFLYVLAFGLPIRNIERKADLSYGIYIYGWPVQIMVFAFGGTAMGMGPYLLLTILALIPFAAFSWFLVEKPAMGARKRVAARLMRKAEA